jgi:hypothetical protein
MGILLVLNLQCHPVLGNHPLALLQGGASKRWGKCNSCNPLKLGDPLENFWRFSGDSVCAGAALTGLCPASRLRYARRMQARCNALVAGSSRHGHGTARRGLFIRSQGIVEWPDGTIATRYAFIHDLYRYRRSTAGSLRDLTPQTCAMPGRCWMTSAHQRLGAGTIAVEIEGRDHDVCVRGLST